LYVIAFFGCPGSLDDQKMETRCSPHPGNEHKRSVNNLWLRMMGNLRGDWLQTGKNEVLATFVAKTEATRFLPHLENECQWSVNDLRSRIASNPSGAQSQTSIKDELAASLSRYASNIPAIASWKVTTYFI